MHDCQETKERLIDLVFGETNAAESGRLLKEVERCRTCEEEYRQIAGALFTFDQARGALEPHESFWAEHHERLRSSLTATQVAEGRQHTPFWRRVIGAQVPVPLPLALAAALLLTVTTLLAMRQPRTVVREAQPITKVEAQTVEVPVPQDRVVVRTVYVERSGRSARATARNRFAPPLSAQTTLARQNGTENTILHGFKPADAVNLQIIKGSFPR